jgi:flagellar basal body-associated protein FliL
MWQRIKAGAMTALVLLSIMVAAVGAAIAFVFSSRHGDKLGQAAAKKRNEAAIKNGGEQAASKATGELHAIIANAPNPAARDDFVKTWVGSGIK